MFNLAHDKNQKQTRNIQIKNSWNLLVDFENKTRAGGSGICVRSVWLPIVDAFRTVNWRVIKEELNNLAIKVPNLIVNP